MLIKGKMHGVAIFNMPDKVNIKISSQFSNVHVFRNLMISFVKFLPDLIQNVSLDAAGYIQLQNEIMCLRFDVMADTPCLQFLLASMKSL